MKLENFLSNIYFQLALILSAFGGLTSDFYGKGYAIAIVLSVIVILYAVYDEYKKSKFYSASYMSLPIVINISNPADSKSALHSLFTILENKYPNHSKNLEKYFSISEDDLIFKYDGDIFNQERFIDFLKITKSQLKKLEKKTPKNINLHLVYIGPASSAILIGGMLGTEGITLYQYNNSTNGYTISFEINSRKYKEPVKEYKILSKPILNIKDEAKTVTVAIDLAFNKIALKKLNEPIVHLQKRTNTAIKDGNDFILANREIYTILNQLQQKDLHIVLAYSMPVSIALLLGMSIQNFWDIELKQFKDGNYETICSSINKIKYFF